jgi:hypothetical protein
MKFWSHKSLLNSWFSIDNPYIAAIASSKRVARIARRPEPIERQRLVEGKKSSFGIASSAIFKGPALIGLLFRLL